MKLTNENFAGALMAAYPELRDPDFDPVAHTQRRPFGPRPVAVLSTTVLPLDGVYRVSTLPAGQTPDIDGVPHYIGHPDTKEIVERLGAVPAPSKLFAGLEPGQLALCFAIAQGRSSRAVDGFSSPHQACGMDDLQIRVIGRVWEDSRPCPFCGGKAAVAVLEEPSHGTACCAFCGAT